MSTGTIDQNQIPSTFDLTDQTVYRWRFWNAKKSIFQAVFLLVVLALVIPALPFGVLYGVMQLSHTAAIWCAWGFIGVAILGTFITIRDRLVGTREESIKGAAGLFSIATMCIGAVHFLLTFSDGEYVRGFSGTEGIGGWGWMVFVVDNFLGVVLLDIPEVYGIHVSPIRPQSDMACAITVAIRIMITIGLVEMILSVYKSELSEQEFFGTVRECVHHCDNFIGATDLMMERTGHVAPEARKMVVEVKSFVHTLKPQL